MKKLMFVCIALFCVTVLTGCGKSHEKVVKEMYFAVGSGDNDEMRKFAEANFAPGLADALKYNKDTKKVFKRISESEGFAKTEVLKAFKKDGSTFSVISARCDGTTLFFVVGGTDDKIVLITTDKDEAMNGRGLEASTRRKPENTPKTPKAGEAKHTDSISTSVEKAARLSPDQKVSRLMAQLRKRLGNGIEASVALAAIQEKADHLQGDYKVKCVLMEMMGNSYNRSGIVPDLPDPNGNGALAEYLKVRGIDDAGNIMCMYHMLKDKEQAAVAEEVRKLLK